MLTDRDLLRRVLNSVIIPAADTSQKYAAEQPVKAVSGSPKIRFQRLLDDFLDLLRAHYTTLLSARPPLRVSSS